MRTVRSLLPVLVLGAVSVAFVGVSAALEDDAPPTGEEPTTTVPAPECAGEEDGGAEDGGDLLPESLEDDGDPCDDATEGTDGEGAGDGETAVDEDPVDEDLDESPASEHPENHGAAVSEAAHTCPPGPEHGPCVSEVARSDAGKVDPETPDDLGDEGDDDDTADDDDDAAGHGNGKGQGGGNGGGRGQGDG